MSVKKEPSGRRSVQVEVEVPGTPEEVWKAIATGAGVSCWFVPSEIEERVGGTMIHNFGAGMESTAIIKEWNPPVHFAAEGSGWMPNSPPIATEFFVEARSGGVCVVRVVHSLFAETDDWDGQLEGTEGGWPVYFAVLVTYLKHFRGMSGRSMVTVAMSEDSESKAWDNLTAQLGMAGLTAGARCKTAKGVPVLAGIIEYTSSEKGHFSTLIRLDQPAPGVALIVIAGCAGGAMINVSLYLYGPSSQQIISEQESAWQAWLADHYPSKSEG